MQSNEDRAGMHKVRTSDPDAVARQVRAARARRGWTQAELAKHAGVSRNSVGSVESGETVHIRTSRAVLGALGLFDDGGDDGVVPNDPPLSRATNEELASELLRRMTPRQ